MLFNKFITLNFNLFFTETVDYRNRYEVPLMINFVIIELYQKLTSKL